MFAALTCISCPASRNNVPGFPGAGTSFCISVYAAAVPRSKQHFRRTLKMVLRFTSTVVDPPAMIYMGRDKEENEELIR